MREFLPFRRANYTEGMPGTSYRYLVNLPDLCGGKTIVEGTRVGVHDVVGLIANGATIDEVLRSFPNLTRAQVYECQHIMRIIDRRLMRWWRCRWPRRAESCRPYPPYVDPPRSA